MAESSDVSSLRSVEHNSPKDKARGLLERVAAVNGGWKRLAFILGQVAGCFGLLGFAVAKLLEDVVHERRKVKDDIAMPCIYLYTTLLSLSSLSAYQSFSRTARRHGSLILFVIWIVYAYRDIYPLLTYHELPKDREEGARLWASVGLLTLTGLIIPLTIPRQYIPLDPSHPFDPPSPELTASWLSLALYSFLDKVIWEAYRVPHLPFESLPALVDFDEAANLKKRSFRHLDVFSGAPKRHAFFGLMRTLWKQYVVMALLLAIGTVASLAAPIGMYKLLEYLETGRKRVTVRPWVWILWLFLGPVVNGIVKQAYTFLATRVNADVQAVLTELMFEHALRIRMTAETEDTPKDPAESSTASTSAAGTRAATPSEEGTAARQTSESTEQTVQATSDSSESSSVAPTKQDDKASIQSEPDKQPKKSDSKNLVGRINNLVTSDLEQITNGTDFLLLFFSAPLQIALCIWFLYAVLDWSAFVGLVVIIAMLPVPGWVGKLSRNVQKNRSQKTDQRVQFVTEAINVIRMIKLFGWEHKIDERIAARRNDELVWVGRRMLMMLFIGMTNFVIPIITMLATYATYTVIMKQTLTAAKVFSSMAVFDLLRTQLAMGFGTLTPVINASVSLARLNEFLHNTELLDRYDSTMTVPSLSAEQRDGLDSNIGFKDTSFTWSSAAANDAWLPASKRRFRLDINGELKFQRGAVNLVVGPTGSGKTSLLMALLGEMHALPAGPDSWVNLPRVGGVAYAPQESWVLNDTIKNNILFGYTYDENRYKDVIYQCGLERDISLFEAGDETEVGEKGLTLSGGQKARVTLARAVYSNTEILLLDDVLAALDVHTSKWVVEKCFKAVLMRGRTVILVTHNVALAAPISSFVVSMKHGRVFSQGSITDVLAKDHVIAEEARHDMEILKEAEDKDTKTDEPAEKVQPSGKLIVEEEVEIGHVRWAAFQMYLGGLAGKHPFIFFTVWLGGFISMEIVISFQTWWLGYWGTQYQYHDPSDVDVPYYLGVYTSLTVLGVVVFCIGFTTFVFGAVRASRAIHTRLIKSMLGSTFRWLDTTPISRIITRCTQDMQSIDGMLPTLIISFTDMTTTMVVRLFAVVVVSPVFIFPSIFLLALGGVLGHVYMKAQLAVRRELSNAKAPVLGHFGAAISGLPSIRAYGAQDRFTEISIARINKYTRALRTFYNLNRWVSVRLDAIGGAFAASLATYLVYAQAREADTIGFSLNMAVSVCGQIMWWIRTLNRIEVLGNSLERVENYVNIEQEPVPVKRGEPPAYWPASGQLRVENLSARYSPDGPTVLQDLNFTIESGQRVGIVGRTGSGKSSLTLSLLRCIVTSGEVYYDGFPTSQINLDALRSSITIIPQVPELLSGTLRQDLDPFEQHDDATLNAALRSAGLCSLQERDGGEEGAKIALDSKITGGGGNLSVGQRQIIALARAIVRDSKLLILDEATSAIDYNTDTVIQESLRTELGKDVTVLTVAHRLRTIMDADRIIILDAGRIIEFDTPRELLKIQGGHLRGMVDESADKDVLYAMAETGD